MDESLKEIIEKIKKYNLEEAIEKLLQLTEEKYNGYYEEVLLQSMAFHRIKDSVRLGVLGQQDSFVEEQRLAKSILKITTTLKKVKATEENQVQKKVIKISIQDNEIEISENKLVEQFINLIQQNIIENLPKEEKPRVKELSKIVESKDFDPSVFEIEINEKYGFLNHPVSRRFAIVYDYLLRNKLIKGKRDLAETMGTYVHVVDSILKGNRLLTVNQIENLVLAFKINVNFLFERSDTILIQEKNKK
jgi:antitoxin component HigA of HigAB toxin-antitoxin module